MGGLLEPGRTLAFRVSGAPANATVTIIRGSAEAQTCPAAIAPNCVDVRNPAVLTTLQVNAQGVGSKNVPIPANANIPDQFTAYLQAVARGGVDTSNVVAKFNPMPDQQGLMTGLLFESATVNPGSYDGVRLEEYDSVYTGLDVCSFVYDVQGTGLAPLAPCPGCEFAFAVTTSNFEEVTSAGDCQELIGLDVSTLTAGQQGVGFEATYNYNGQNIPVMMIYDTSTGSWVAAANAIFNNPTFYWLATFPAAGYAYIY